MHQALTATAPIMTHVRVTVQDVIEQVPPLGRLACEPSHLSVDGVQEPAEQDRDRRQGEKQLPVLGAEENEQAGHPGHDK